MLELQDWQDLRANETHIFHVHDNKVQGQDVLVQRIQRGSLCYLHAPAVLSHYIVSRNNLTDPSAMTNIALQLKYSKSTGRS